MTPWDCLCQMQTPSIRDILRNIREHTVCTGIQCFETENDAFGITEQTAACKADALAFCTIVFLAFLAITFAPPSITNIKYRREVRANSQHRTE